MPFIVSLIGAIGGMIVTWGTEMLVALGVSFVTYKGVGAGLDALKANVIGGTSGMSADMLNLVGYLWLDKALTMVMSAMTFAISFRLSVGSWKSVKLK